MRILIWVLGGLIALVLLLAGGILAFDAPSRPPMLAAVTDPFKGIDLSDLPPLQRYAARDGTMLGYRVYDASGPLHAVLIHGSTDDGTGLHLLAKGMQELGITCYVPVLRGHGDFGRRGDIDYIGQLEDDLADLVAVLRQPKPDLGLGLVGFSSGGGFVLRVIDGKDEALFDRFELISPALPYPSPTIRPGTGGFVSAAVPRFILIGLLDRLGIHWFDGLSVVAFATNPDVKSLTSEYSYRMAVDFGAPRDYLAGLARSKKPATLIVGGRDELFFPDQFEPLFRQARSDMPIIVAPEFGHIGITVAPRGIAAIRQSLLDIAGLPVQRQ
jgi:non-heme chloroperoxidase